MDDFDGSFVPGMELKRSVAGLLESIGGTTVTEEGCIIPSFVANLYTILETEESPHLRWDSEGDTFVCADFATLERTLLSCKYEVMLREKRQAHQLRALPQQVE